MIQSSQILLATNRLASKQAGYNAHKYFYDSPIASRARDEICLLKDSSLQRLKLIVTILVCLYVFSIIPEELKLAPVAFVAAALSIIIYKLIAGFIKKPYRKQTLKTLTIDFQSSLHGRTFPAFQNRIFHPPRV
jgi:hypothetical protein